MSESGESPVKAFLMDKGIDAILIPVGLFAALWFQNWVDNKKEREDYASLITDFTAELQTNRDKAKVLEKDLGPVTDLENPLGPLNEKFEVELDKAKRLALTLQCLDVIAFKPVANELAQEAAIAAGEATEETEEAAAEETEEAAAEETEEAAAEAGEAKAEEEEVEAPDPLLLPADKSLQAAFCEKFFEEEDPDTTTPAVDLAPFYQKVVWQVYTSDGIKLFKDAEAKRLGLQLGELYASQEEVERRVREINDLFNNSMADASGKMDVLGIEVNDLVAPLLASDGDLDPKQVGELRLELQGMVKRARELRYAIDSTHSVMLVKSLRLKEYLKSMNGQLDTTIKALETEKGRIGG